MLAAAHPNALAPVARPITKAITQDDALILLRDKQATMAEVQVFLEKLNASKSASKNNVSFKVSVKGAVSVYGLGRWPITLYKGQWAKLFEVLDALKQFIVVNDAQLSVKGDKSDENGAA